jgi:hypothetical protein
MDAFLEELMRRSPLATAVLDVCDYLFDDRLLDDVWERHRGRCYQDVLTFAEFLRLMRDALIHHGGSAHKLFVGLESRDEHPVDESNFYRKLARTPVALGRALLRQCTARLSQVMPTGATTTTTADLPACFDGFAMIAADGKTIKNAAKRLKPTRGYVGKLLGAKALVALDLRGGLALAMSDSLDGMANEVPLVPALMPQLYEAVGPSRPILSVWDRQFDDVRTMRLLSGRAGDAFVVRAKHKNAKFTAESTVESRDGQGRRVTDEVGVLGTGAKAMRVRRVTLARDVAAGGEEDVVLLSDLLDRDRYPAADLLALYRERWGIERVFQQVTETFSLDHLIGSAPRAVLLQFAFCLLLYNVMQVIRAYVARDGGVRPAAVSMYYLFDDARTELRSWAYHCDDDGQWPPAHRDAATLRARLAALLHGTWNAVRYAKATDKHPRARPPDGTSRQWLSGGHTSVQRMLDGTAKVVKRKAVVTRERGIPDR